MRLTNELSDSLIPLHSQDLLVCIQDFYTYALWGEEVGFRLLNFCYIVFFFLKVNIKVL